MQKTALPLVACLLALSLTGAHAQTLWKWRDASGQLHISDTAPPAGTPAKNIVSSPPGGVLPPPSSLTAAAAAPATPAASTPAAVSSLDKKKAAADQEKADKEKADRAALDAKNAAARKENCASAQASLAGLQSGQRIARINDKGEREVLDDSGRADEIKRVQGIVASNCGAASAAQ
jgi:hypothetical protein